MNKDLFKVPSILGGIFFEGASPQHLSTTKRAIRCNRQKTRAVYATIPPIIQL